MTKLIVRGGSILGAHKRKKFDTNEDYFIKDRKNNFFAVADGLGGHNAGAEASKYATLFLQDRMKDFLSDLRNKQYDDDKIKYNLKNSIEYTNSLICTLANNIHTKNFGTTLTTLLINNNKAYIGHLGDSSIFLYRNKTLSKLTEDHHTLDESIVENGYQRMLLDRSAPLSKYVGKKDAEPFMKVQNLNSNDILLLCTDGVSKYVYEDEIAQIIEQNKFNQIYQKLLNRVAYPKKMAEILSAHENIGLNEAKLHFKVYERGDNTTALLIKVIE